MTLCITLALASPGEAAKRLRHQISWMVCRSSLPTSTVRLTVELVGPSACLIFFSLLSVSAAMKKESPLQSDNSSNSDNPALTRIGLRGVRLKKFEEIVADLLVDVTPTYSQLPPFPTTSSSSRHNNNSWPFDKFPACICISGNDPGQVSHEKRALQKQGQVVSLLRCIVPMMQESRSKVTVVDFCGGTGHLAIPLALLFPYKCNVIVVDVKAKSLELVHEKAHRYYEYCCQQDDINNPNGTRKYCRVYPKQEHVDATSHDRIKRQCRGIPNLYTYHGSIEAFEEHFDIGVALHGCGEASDIVLRKCASVQANFVLAPCCVGKLNSNSHDPYVYYATSLNDPTVSYPQSTKFQRLLQKHKEQWDVLAKAADYSSIDAEWKTARNCIRRTAKALLETDRLLYMQEQYGYKTCLARMDPWTSSPKNDILMGWLERDHNKTNTVPNTTTTIVGSPYNGYSSSAFRQCPNCNADIRNAREHLLSTSLGDSFRGTTAHSGDTVDWTEEEVKEIEIKLNSFVLSEEKKLIFPTGMGSRLRKLVHYKAEQMNLAHWCQGKKYSEKTVVVAKRHGKTQKAER